MTEPYGFHLLTGSRRLFSKSRYLPFGEKVEKEDMWSASCSGSQKVEAKIDMLKSVVSYLRQTCF